MVVVRSTLQYGQVKTMGAKFAVVVFLDNQTRATKMMSLEQKKCIWKMNVDSDIQKPRKRKKRWNNYSWLFSRGKKEDTAEEQDEI